MTTASGVVDVQARIAAIQARFPTQPTRPNTANAAAFATALSGAQTGTPAAGYTLDAASATDSLTVAAGSSQASGTQVIDAAKRYLGVPYVWGGTDPSKGLDCSGFVQRVYKDLGIELPRVSRDQARAGTPVASLAQAQPGDLVAFGSPVDHIGIYAGNNKMIVAPSRGDVVKFQDVYRTPTAIRRILPAAGAADPLAALQSLMPAAAPSQAKGPAAFAALFRAAEAKNNLPAGLLNAVAKNESNYNPRAVSPAGARGLMQIMPATARELGVNPDNPVEAIDGAARLLASNLRQFKSIDLAVAAYNAGAGAVARHGGIPPYSETRTYVTRVLSTLRGV